MTFVIRNITMLRNGPFMSYQLFKKVPFLKKVRFNFFIKQFLHTFCQKWTFCYPTTFIEWLITHKRFIFEESYISYDKRQKTFTLIVILVRLSYLTSPIFNSSAKSNRTFYLPVRKYIANSTYLVRKEWFRLKSCFTKFIFFLIYQLLNWLDG